jgi:hypothetical protein
MLKVYLNDNIKYLRTDKLAANKFDLSYFYRILEKSFNTDIELETNYLAYYIDP